MTRKFAWVLLLLVTVPSAAFAQSGSVAGSVVDQTGGVVPGASVTLSGADSRRTTTTGVNGDFRFTAVPPGTYNLEVLIPGFAPASRAGIAVAEGPVSLEQLTLSLATVGEAVVVSASRVE